MTNELARVQAALKTLGVQDVHVVGGDSVRFRLTAQDRYYVVTSWDGYVRLMGLLASEGRLAVSVTPRTPVKPVVSHVKFTGKDYVDLEIEGDVYSSLNVKVVPDLCDSFGWHMLAKIVTYDTGDIGDRGRETVLGVFPLGASLPAKASFSAQASFSAIVESKSKCLNVMDLIREAQEHLLAKKDAGEEK